MSDIFEKFSLKGQVAVVTGGAGLLGKQFCRTLAQAGAAVVVADLNTDAAAAVAGELKRDGFTASGWPDRHPAESARAMVAQTVQAFGRLDVLVGTPPWPPNSILSIRANTRMPSKVTVEAGGRRWTST